jgi:hypothetical protein
MNEGLNEGFTGEEEKDWRRIPKLVSGKTLRKGRSCDVGLFLCDQDSLVNPKLETLAPTRPPVMMMLQGRRISI